MKLKIALRCFLITCGSLFLEQSVTAASGTWTPTTAGPFDWSSTATGNWSGGIVADGQNSTANFIANITAAQTVNLAEDRTIGNILFTDSTTDSHNLTISGANILTLDLSSGIPIINVTQSARTLTISGQIAGNDGLQKSGAGTLTLSGANSITGAITINRGSLVADTVTNATILSTSSGLAFTGTGTFQLKGLSGQARSQILNGLTLTSGAATIDANNVAGGTSTTIDLRGTGGLQTITRSAGATVDFKATTGTFGTTAIVNTAQANDSTGILGAWATVNGGVDWAMNNGSGVVTAYTGYSDLAANTLADSGSTNYRVTSGTTGNITMAATGTINANTLRINDATARTIDVRNGTTQGILRFGAAGGLLTSGGAHVIGVSGTAGTITAGGADDTAGEIILNAPSLLTINSIIANNGTGVVSLTTSGSSGTTTNGNLSSTGTVILNGANTYTGDTFINAGTLRIGTNNTANGAKLGGASGNYAGNIYIAGGALLWISTDASQTLSGTISGDGALQKSYSGTLRLSGNNTYTGKTSISPSTTAGAGTLEVFSLNSVNGGTPLLASSSLGAPTTVANGTIDLGGPGSVQGGATLKYLGSGETTDRILNIQFGSNTNRTIDTSGSGLLKFTSTVTFGNTGSAAVTTVTLTGSSDGEFVGGLPHVGAWALSKSGTGTWTLGGTVGHTGGLSVSGGVLSLQKRVSVFNNTAASWTPALINVNSGTTLALGVGASASGYFSMTELGTFLDGTHMGASTATTGFKSGAALGFDTTNASGGTFTYTSSLGNLGTAASTGLTKVGIGTLILDQNNTYTGATSVNEGTLQVDAAGTLGATTAALNMGTGSATTRATVGNLTMNTDVTVGAFAVKSNTLTTTGADVGVLSVATTKTLTTGAMTVGLASGTVAGQDTRTALSTAGGGSLVVNGVLSMSQAGNATPATSAISVLDLSGLANFTNNNSGGTTSLGNAVHSYATLTLASTSNLINATTLSIAPTTSNSNLGESVLNLGAGTNTIQASTITIGTGKGQGTFQFAGSNGSVTISGTGGVGTAAITVGNATAGTYITAGRTNNLLLAGHLATVSAGAVLVGQNAGNTGVSGGFTSHITFDTGTFNATSVTLASNTSGTSATAPTATFTMGGPTANSAANGVLTVTGNFLLANNVNSNAAATGAVNGSLIINGGTINIGSGATNGIYDATTSTTGSSTTMLTLSGGTLNLNGGVIGGTLNAGKKNIGTLNFESGTLKNVSQINGGAGLAKTTNGTLILDGTNSYTGVTTVNAGTLRFAKQGALYNNAEANWTAANINVKSGATLAFHVGGTNEFTTGNVTTLFTNLAGSSSATNGMNAGSNFGFDTTNASGGTFTIADSIADSSGASGGARGLTKLGTGTLELTNTNTYSGPTTIGVGTLAVNGSGSINNSAVTVTGGTFRYNSSVAYSGSLTFTSGTIAGTNLTGSLGGQFISTGKAIAPGNSPGTASTTDQTWATGGTYLWEIYDATGIAGTGWDLLSGTGTLDVPASAGNLFTIDLSSLSAVSPDSLGNALNFDNTQSHVWLIADFAAVTNFASSDFSVDDNGFSNTINGAFGVSLGGGALPGDNTQVYLTYTPIPEPGAALLGSLGLLLIFRRRR